MRRTGIIAFALVAVLSLVPAVANAATTGAPSAPATIAVEGFESLASPTFPVLEHQWPTAQTYWGRVTQRHLGGSYGLWCAGSGPSTFTPDPWQHLNGNYQSTLVDIEDAVLRRGTEGTAYIPLSALGDYYSSKLEFSYSLPAMAPADSFYVHWSSAANEYPLAGNVQLTEKTLSNGWIKKSYDLSSATAAQSLSRRAGFVRFWWLTDSNTTGATGEGATVDDVTITGYKYGPVRGLNAVVQPNSSVTLTWLKPYGSTDSSVADARSVSYRIWRRDPAAKNTPSEYVELTDPTRVTALTYNDPTALASHGYQYWVQAWDPGTGIAGWGELAAPAIVGVVNGELKGIVTSGGNPLAGATVSVPGYAPATTGADGSYLVSDIAPGPYTVTYSKAGYVTTTQAVTIAAGAALDRPAVLAVVAVPVPHTYGTSTTLSGRSSVKVKKYTPYYSGRVSSPAAGPVTISLKRKVGRKWKNAGTVRAYAVNGAFRFRFKPKYKGSWKMTATLCRRHVRNRQVPPSPSQRRASE